MEEWETTWTCKYDIIREMNVGKDAFLRNEEGVFSFITYSW